MENQTFRNLRQACAEAFPAEACDAVDRALGVAAEYLEGQMRYDGRPMLEHGAAVAQIVVREIGLDAASAIAAILHDAVRMADKLNDDFIGLTDRLRARFGDEVLGITLSLSNISKIRLKMSNEQAANFRDLIVSYSEDPRVILVKLADRLEVMRRLDMFPPAKRRRKSWESLNLYAQIAHKLGLYNLKSELEDISLSYLEPNDYAHIVSRLRETESERRDFIARFLEPITQRLDRSGMHYHVKSRTKSIFSIWNKMRRQKVPFEGVYDIFAIRIIIDCPPEAEKPLCWSVYSIVTDCYTPNPDRLRDWISIPKSNGYESLQTTVSAGGGRWVEIQIRSERMDEVAERGIAAHWRYKGVGQGALTSEMWLGQLRELVEQTPQSLARRFDAKPGSGEIFAFTPNGDLRKLPEGATVLDFAFDIHSNLGATCVGGRVNNRAVPIREKLHNGDIVEILTQKNQTPKTDWLNFAVTTKARSRIRAMLREEQAKNARMGREELERKLKNWKFALTIDEAVALLTKHYKMRTGTALYEQIATARIDLQQIKEVLQREVSGAADEERRKAAEELEQSKLPASRPAPGSDALIIDEQISRIQYKLARCCNPIRGDAVFGFVTINSGITIHRSDCPNAVRLKENYPYRVLPARWQQHAEGAFRATIRIVADDTTGMVNRITEVINRELRLDIRSMNLDSAGGVLQGEIHVQVPQASVVDTLIHSILRIKGIQRAYRVNN